MVPEANGFSPRLYYVSNELVHAGRHARPQEVDTGMPSQGDQ